MKYRFKWKKGFFWQSTMVIGHRYSKEDDKMILYTEDGGIRELVAWSKCEVILGADWVLVAHKNLEQQAGMSIPLTAGIG